MGERVSTGKVDIEKERLKFLEMSSLVNTVLEKRYFPKVIEALEKNKQKDFETICDSAEVPNGVRNMLWETLKNAYEASEKENPWLC